VGTVNPYHIDELASISFSGGRTSAFMLHKILEAHNGTLPESVKVTFANTGKEMPQTLDFVQACSDQWGVDIVWLELGEYKIIGEYKKGAHKGKPRYKAQTVIVDHETASRHGEPFARLVKRRRYLPNVMARFCTAELKVRRIRDYLNGIQKGGWTQCIGIRADEPHRAARMQGKKDAGHELYLPLWVDRITKEDVYAFWKSQLFDLQLPNNNGTTDWGNCDLCYLKGFRKKLSIVRERPELADWWAEQEDKMTETAGTAARFRNDQPGYKEMQIIAKQQSGFDFFNDETIPCFCGD